MSVMGVDLASRLAPHEGHVATNVARVFEAKDLYVLGVDHSEGNHLTGQCPRHESNMRTRFRKPLLYPLSYGGSAEKGSVAGTRAERAPLNSPARRHLYSLVKTDPRPWHAGEGRS